LVTRNLKADIVAGLSVAGLMVPEAVAYAGIAGLPPSRAILAAIAGGAAYCIFGRSRFAVVAPTSSSAAILAAAIASLPGDAAVKAVMATVLVGLVGLSFLLIAALRLGGLSGFIARPVLRGFAFGLAITIIIKQLPTLLGVHVVAANPFMLLAAIMARIGSVNIASIAIGAGALVLLLTLKRLTRLPGALIVLSLGIALSFVIDLQDNGVALVGPIPLNFARPVVPFLSFNLWSRLAQLALPLTLILFAESWGTIRALALRCDDTVSAGKELGALGAANLLSALVQGMPVGAGFSAGSANEAAGATSRWAAALAAVSVGAILLLAGQLVARVAEPILAAIVIAALTHALSLAPIKRLFAIKRDGWIALAAAGAVILLGVLNGMLMAIALSVAILLRRLASPTISALGQLDESHDYVDMSRHQDATPEDGIAIFRPNAPLFFANADAAMAGIAARCESLANVTNIIVSLEESDDLDSGALDALIELQKTLQSRGMTLSLARVHDRVRDLLIRAGYATLAGMSNFSVADAVSAATSKKDFNDARSR
jgi:MFS superfamily sulfate permease-like transporter